MSITERATISQVTTAATSTGITLPKPVTAAVARAARLTAAVRSIGPREGDLYAAVAAAVDAGTDPGADPAVQRTLAASGLANDGVMRGVDSIAAEGTREAMTEHRDEIVEAFRAPFNQAAAALVAAHKRLGNIALDDTTTVIRLGGDAAAVWAEATAAAGTIRTVIDGWAGLATLVRLPVNPNRQVLRMVDVPPERWAELDGRSADPWAAIGAGLTLNLPTLSEYVARNAAIDRHLAEPEMVVDTGRSHVAGREIRAPA